MKHFITALALSISALTATAQDIFDNPDNHAHLGVRLSYELACPTDVHYSIANINVLDAGSGFSAGVIYNIPVWKNLFFEPGATLYYNTYSFSNDIISNIGDFDPAFDDLNISGASVRQWGMRLPLIVGYHFDFIPEMRLSFFTGPELTLGFSAKTHLDMGKISGSANAYGSDGFLNRCDVKWRFGVGATFFDHYYAAISGAAGICDVYKDALSMRSNLFDITIGYNF